MSNCEYCEYCDVLINKYEMKRHHQTKKCLLKQEVLKQFKCVCSEKFISRERLDEHASICLYMKLENKLKEKEKEIEDLKLLCENRLKEINILSLEKKILQTKLEGKEECLSIAKTAKGTTTTNNTNNNIKNMVVFNLSERINPALSNYTKEHLLQGAKGTAKWINENIITDENGNKLYICSDRSREIFKFMNEKGEVVTDVKAEFLLGSINPKLIPIASEIKTKRVK